MMSPSKIIFIFFIVFMAVFYFLIIPVPKIIVRYEQIVNKTNTLSQLQEENESINKIIAEIDNENYESLKYIANLKEKNEKFIIFNKENTKQENFKIKNKLIFQILYYLFGVMMFSISLISVILDDPQTELTNKNIRNRSRFSKKYYWGQ